MIFSHQQVVVSDGSVFGQLNQCEILSTNNYSSSCNTMAVTGSDLQYIGLNGIDIMYDPKPIALCSYNASLIYHDGGSLYGCAQFFNQTFREQLVAKYFKQVNDEFELRWNQSSYSWVYKTMSKPVSISFVNTTMDGYSFSSLLSLYDYCNYCNHSLFSSFQSLKSNNEALQLPVLDLAFSKAQCGNGVPFLGPLDPSQSTTSIQCICKNGVISNACGEFYTDFFYPLFVGGEVCIVSIVTYSLILLFSIFFNFIPILLQCGRRFMKSQRGIRSLLYHFSDLRLQASIIFMLSMLLAILSSIFGAVGNSFSVLTMTLAAALQFVASVPILFCWIDVIYRTEMKMKQASSLIM